MRQSTDTVRQGFFMPDKKYNKIRHCECQNKQSIKKAFSRKLISQIKGNVQRTKGTSEK